MISKKTGTDLKKSPQLILIERNQVNGMNNRTPWCDLWNSQRLKLINSSRFRDRLKKRKSIKFCMNFGTTTIRFSILSIASDRFLTFKLSMIQLWPQIYHPTKMKLPHDLVEFQEYLETIAHQKLVSKSSWRMTVKWIRVQIQF